MVSPGNPNKSELNPSPKNIEVCCGDLPNKDVEAIYEKVKRRAMEKNNIELFRSSKIE